MTFYINNLKIYDQFQDKSILRMQPHRPSKTLGHSSHIYPMCAQQQVISDIYIICDQKKQGAQ